MDSMTIVQENVDKIQSLLNWEEMSKNENISTEFIENNIDKPWDFYYLSANPNVTEDVVERFPDKPWNWVILHLLNDFHIELIKKYITSYEIFTESWNWILNVFREYDDALSFKDVFRCAFHNRHFKIKKLEILIEVIESPIDKFGSESILFTNKFIVKHIDKFDFNCLSKNDNITKDIVERFSDKPWNWLSLYSIKEFPLEFIKKHITSLDAFIKDANERGIYILSLEFVECFKDHDWSSFTNDRSFPLNWEDMLCNFNYKKIVDLINSFPDNTWDWDYICNHVDVYRITTDLIKSLPDKPWNWERICNNINFDSSTLKFITSFPDKPWNWERICGNNNINYFTMHLIMSFPDKPWNWEHVCNNINSDNFTLDLIKSFPNKPWNWERICRFDFRFSNYDYEHGVRMLSTIVSFPDKQWDWNYICNDYDFYKNFTLEFMKLFPDKQWNWDHICHQEYYDLELVKSFPDKPWNWGSVSNYIDFDYVKSFQHKPWDWCELSQRTNEIATPENILTFPDLPWDWEELSRYISIDFIASNFNKPWDLEYIFKHRCSTKSFLLFPDLPCDWKLLSTPNYFNYEILEYFPDLPWDWKVLSKSENVPINFVTLNKDKDWDWDEISKNAKMFQNLSIKIIAIEKIVKQFRESMSNPEYILCRKRLCSEFKELCAF